MKRKIRSTEGRPRLAVYRSLKHIYAQIINDEEHRTLLLVSTLDKELKKNLKKSKDLEAARQVGEELAKRALAAGIKQVVFDRSGRVYHGRIKAVAEGARAAGLTI